MHSNNKPQLFNEQPLIQPVTESDKQLQNKQQQVDKKDKTMIPAQLHKHGKIRSIHVNPAAITVNTLKQSISCFILIIYLNHLRRTIFCLS